jgi:hypothetical protein
LTDQSQKLSEDFMFLKNSILAGSILMAASQSASAVIIKFDYTYDGGFFTGANVARQAILNAAGSFLGSSLTDNLSAITSIGRDKFTAIFDRPDDGVSTSLTNFGEAANTLTVFVGGRSLGGSTLGVGGFGGYDVSYITPSFLTTVTQRGQTGPTQTTTTNDVTTLATDFAPWGGQIAFNTLTNWYFDADPTTTESFSGNDFYSVALHEIGHLLGLGTADSWKDKISGSSFTGTNSVAAFGGNVPLAVDGAHWKDGTLSTTLAGLTQEVMMDPSLTTRTRKLATKLDFAALKDVGWQVAAVPVPAAIWLFGTGLAVFAGLHRKYPMAQA